MNVLPGKTPRDAALPEAAGSEKHNLPDKPTFPGHQSAISSPDKTTPSIPANQGHPLPWKYVDHYKMKF
jgi:hypothetical protein